MRLIQILCATALVSMMLPVSAYALGLTAGTDIAIESTVGPATPVPPPFDPPPKVPVAKKVAPYVLCSCVIYLREAFDIPIHGDAWDVRGNIKKKDAQVGDVALIDYPGTSHVALITGVASSTLTIKEANFHSCQASTRKIALSRVRGIYRPLSTA